MKNESDGIEIIAPEKTDEEKTRLDNDMKQLLKSLSERKRRTFLRYKNGRIDSKNEEAENNPVKLYPNREELMLKLEQLNITNDVLSSDDEEEWASELSD